MPPEAESMSTDYTLAWATDIHLDQCDTEHFDAFIESIQSVAPQGLCLTGDLSEATTLERDLCGIADRLEIPVYFVLGNHDYYHGSIAEVRQEMRKLSTRHPFLRWLPAVGKVALNTNTTLIGHGGWGDGGNGNIQKSWIRLQDFRKIKELMDANGHDESWTLEERKNRPITPELITLLKQLGQEGAEHIKPLLYEVLRDASAPHHVVLLMHAPPFRETCLYGTEMADDHWAAHFTCKAMGDVIEDAAKTFPQHQITVLAGHTHNVCDVSYRDNLRVCVGAAEYGSPMLAKHFIF